MLFTTSVLAGSADQALAKVEKYAERAGVRVTGNVSVKSERHGLWNVETELLGSKNEAWVILTSYGMSPSEDLGSVWQTMEGVGR